MLNWQEGLSNPVANESVVLMVMQTLRHLHPSPRSPHLRRIHRFSPPPSRFGVFLVLMELLVISFDGIMDIVYSLLSDASARQLTCVACRDLQRDIAHLKSCGDSPNTFFTYDHFEIILCFGKNPQPSTPPLQAGCTSDLALSPEVRPPAELVPIMGV